MPPIIHVGLPKAASSYVKRSVFSRASRNVVVPRGKLFKRLLDSDFDPEDWIRQVERECIAPPDPLILSNEALCGISLEIGFEATSQQEFDRASQISANLSYSYPNAKIVLFIREQLSHVLSSYRYAIKHGKRVPDLNTYLQRATPDLEQRLDYSKLIRLYQTNFKSENMLVLPFERLYDHEPDVQRELIEFCGLNLQFAGLLPEQNRTPQDGRVIAAMRSTRLVPAALNKAEKVLKSLRYGVHNALKSEQEAASQINRLVHAYEAIFNDGVPMEVARSLSDELRDRFRTSNSATEVLTGTDLTSYGYATTEN